MVEVSNEMLYLGLGGFILFLVLFVLMLFLLRPRQQVSVQKKVSKKAKEKVSSHQLRLPLEYSEEKGFNAVFDRRSKRSFGYWKDWWRNRKSVETISLVNMEMNNGFHRSFLVKERDEGFKYFGKKYLFDGDAKYYVVDSHLWAYDFHEGFSLPIKRVIPLGEVRKTLEGSQISEVEYATNPMTLERFAVSKIAEGIMRGAELDQVFRFLKLMSILILVVVLLHLVLYAQKSGVLSQVNLPI